MAVMVSHCISSAVVLCTLINLALPQFSDYVALTPASVFGSLKLWTVTTYPLVHESSLIAVFYAGLISIMGPYCEAQYTRKRDFIWLLALTTVIAGMVAFSGVVVWFMLHVDPDVLFYKVCGLSGIIATMLVSMKQHYPDKELIPGTPIKFKHLPFFSLIIAVLGAIVHPSISTGTQLLLIVSGFYCSWVYLRFYHRNYSMDSIGDADEDFSFSSFFPGAFARSLCVIPSHVCYRTARSMGFLEGFANAHMTIPVHSRNTTPGPKSSRDPAAERRRALAIKVINDKLAERSGATDEKIQLLA